MLEKGASAMVWREELTTTSTNILYNSAQNHHIIVYRWTNLPGFSTVTRIGSWRCDCLVTWFCYQLMAKPGSKTAIPSYINETLWSYCPLRKYWFWPFMCSNFIRKQKYVFACDVIPRDWNRQVSVNSHFRRQRPTHFTQSILSSLIGLWNRNQGPISPT